MGETERERKRSRMVQERCREESGMSIDPEPEVPSPPVREDGFQYDVFLSFRGPDTRKTFADLLNQVLKDKGVITFIDSEKLEKGQKLEELLERIQRSKIFVPIFSRGYADSEWCLKEIAKMVECKRVILPLFIDVEPTVVRRQTESFGSAFSKHRKNKEIAEAEVSNWSNALKEAGSASGYTLATTDGYQGKFIQQIVKKILNEVNKTSKLPVATHPVGLDSRILDVIEVLETEARDDVRMVGIYGMGGIGKTTLSTAVYNEISSRFDACSFISDVREAAERPSGLVSLQEQLLRDVLNQKDVTINNTRHGLRQIKERIGAKKVLLVLDDVNDVEQIEKLVGNLKGFHSGSRIIITTRDKRVLTSAEVKENHVYELKGLDDIQSLELFSWHAFGKKEPDAKFADLSNQVASTTAGLPLALTIFGSLFFDLTTVEAWRYMLEKLEKDLHKKIHERLRISYDVLDDNEKEVFLDIACFLVGQKTKPATLMWEACGFFPRIAINQLIHKSLVSRNDEGKFEMHDHVRDMGRKIVQAKAKEAGKYSRLWKDDETVDVLQSKRGTEDVEAIRMGSADVDVEDWEEDSEFVNVDDWKRDSVSVDVDDLAAMSQLRMLLLQDVTLKGGYEHFPRKLKWLKWSSQALEKFPSSLHLQGFNQLKVLDLSDCQKLSICPDFGSMIHLEVLILKGCREMSELHPSIGLLKCLTHLSLRECRSLKELPQEVWQLTKLQEFDLYFCSEITTLPSLKHHLLGELKVLTLTRCHKLTTCPDFMGMPCLEILYITGCFELSELHPSIGHLKSLTNLKLSYCRSLKEVPQEVWQLSSLPEHDFSGCSKITALPSQVHNAESLKQPLLESLDLSYCLDLIKCPEFTCMPHLQSLSFRGCEKITKLDPSIGQLEKLMELDLNGCRSLKELPQEIGQLTSLKQLIITCCSSLKEVPQEVWQLTSLQAVGLSGNRKITALPSQVENAESLKQPLLEILDLSDCRNLIKCPELTCMPHLQSLSFRDCEKITKLDPSIGQLEKLTELDLYGCRSLKELPQGIGQLTSLKQLTLTGCSSLKEVPQEIWQLTSVTSLDFSGCSKITALPSQVQNAESLKQPLLESLDLSYCLDLIKCPEFTCMPHLQSLSFRGCKKITKLDPSIGQLQRLTKLDLRDCKSLKELPQEIGQLTSLIWLTLTGCSSLKEVPSLPCSLIVLDAAYCHQLESIADVSNLKEFKTLDLRGCIRLEDIPGVEQLNCLKNLLLGGCRRLADSLFERVQKADFEHLHVFSNPGRLINDGSSIPQPITFILPKQFNSGLVCLCVDERSMDNIRSALEKSNDASPLPDESVVGEDEESVVSEDEESIVGEDEESVVGEDEESIVSEDESVVGEDEESDEESVVGEDEESVVSEDEESPLPDEIVVGEDGESVVGEDEKSIVSEDEESVVGEDEVTQPEDSQLGRSVVRIDITADDAQFSFTTFIHGRDESTGFPTTAFELMMMAKQGRFKGNDVDDAQGRGMMEMCVSIDGCILLRGDLLTSERSVNDEDFNEDSDEDLDDLFYKITVFDEFHYQIRDAGRRGDNIVLVKFG